MKKIQFIEETNQHARLLTRLRYDRIKQGDFFRNLVSLYLSNDIDMIKVIEKIKSNTTNTGKHKIKRSTKDILEGEKLMEDLGLSKKERSEIFDLIEEDFE